RGINTVVFVVNFLNLLTTEEQQEVRQRVNFIAESFRSDLPAGVSNIYCVDALPALRARLKGNLPAAQATGLTTLESALQTIASHHHGDRKHSRTIKVAEQLIEQGKIKQQQLERSLQNQHQESQQQIEVRQKAAKLIQQGFERSLSDLRGWLYLPKLLTNYQPSLAIALQATRFNQWLTEFELEVGAKQQTVNKWIVKGGEFFAHADPQLLAINLPDPPVIEIIESIATDRVSDQISDSSRSQVNREVNPILKSKVSSVILGGASYVLNKVAPKPSSTSVSAPMPNPTAKVSSQVYVDAAAAYITQLSDRTNYQLDAYEKLALQYITYTPQPNRGLITATKYQLQLIDGLISNLETELANL
ncbi:MAG: dynamin, partial [Cyanobacteria bacterium J06600_6]